LDHAPLCFMNDESFLRPRPSSHGHCPTARPRETPLVPELGARSTLPKWCRLEPKPRHYTACANLDVWFKPQAWLTSLASTDLLPAPLPSVLLSHLGLGRLRGDSLRYTTCCTYCWPCFWQPVRPRRSFRCSEVR